ncbi:MAG: hypothetical protein JSS81_16115 [Acidobacteria bacterium]|nr:hypothetical protein [Acidobacteriota bacterium]
MIGMQNIRLFTALLILAFTMFAAACGSGAPPTAQAPRPRPSESPTPEYKPLKRVSRDVIKTETRDEEVVKVKSKQ